MFREIKTIEQLIKYAKENNWALKWERDGVYYLITPAGIHVSVKVNKESGEIKGGRLGWGWGNTMNP